ncbi:MAG TPA: HEAT repeat domain-containing protein [Vicinamibacterales bacterium]|nr:HEAT repeat domain-containing protein [Vicinamibacterales bacterium]
MADAATSGMSRLVPGLARAIVAAARARALYPGEHPAVTAALARLEAALAEAVHDEPLSLGITPDALVPDGAEPLREGPAGEAAAMLHARDVLRLVFAPALDTAVVHAFVDLIAADPAALRERGGPAGVWREHGLAGIAITQVDYEKVLEDREATPVASRRDDVWQAIVRSVLQRRKVLDENMQRRLLAIAGDPGAIGELAKEIMAPSCTPDGSPLVMTQAAAVVAAYNHLHDIVAVLAPDRREEMFRNLAIATAQLDPRVVMQMMRGALEADSPEASPAGAPDTGVVVMKGVAAAFDDMNVAQLLATTLALEGQASARLASVFEAIAPDEERRRRVLRLTRGLLHGTPAGKRGGFEAMWQSMETLLLTYNERPFVSNDYRAALDHIGARADRMAAAELPPELEEWLQTLDQDNVRRLSVTLLIDLLNLETDAARAPVLAADLCALAEDMLMAGDYEAAADIAVALSSRAADRRAVTREACRVALDQLGSALPVRETVALLEGMDEAHYAQVRRFCTAVGAAVVESLRGPIAFEDGRDTRARTRASETIIGFGAAAVGRLAPLTGSPQWHVQRNACELLEAIASPEAVPLLQPLLRGSDPRVLRQAVKALSNIDDPVAARAIHTVLRAATGEARQAVVSALASEKDPRVVPLLARILSESDPLGVDHGVVLETLHALGMFGEVVTPPAVNAVAGVMRRRRWFARRKARALAETSLATLRRVGTPEAQRALADAAQKGDRLLRRLAAGQA